MKKFLSFFLIFLALMSSGFASGGVNEFVLENGMYVAAAEDFSSPLVRIEYTAKAGFSKQTVETSGFFPLYARLFKYASPQDRETLSELEVECNADSSRYVVRCTVSGFDRMLRALSNAVFNPVFQDEDLERELSGLKKEVSEYAFSIEGFINASIDSRVFSESPWEHDSGIYPVLFSKTTTAGARAVLSHIQEIFYTPKNSALFISGPVKKETVLELAQLYFGKRYNSSPRSDSANEYDGEHFSDGEKSAQKKRFVLSDPEFSPDMTQIVVQYTDLPMTECDFLSAILDAENSKLKQTLLADSSLEIRAEQYINAAGTHTNGNSRLIIQSLMESQTASPCKNAVDFISCVRRSFDLITEEDFEAARHTLIQSFYKSIDSSSNLMDLLSQLWAVKDYALTDSAASAVTLSDLFFQRVQKLEECTLDSLKEAVRDSEPFVFVMENSKQAGKYKAEFSKEGFDFVTAKNGSWYMQELYKNLKLNIENEKSADGAFSENTDDLFAESFRRNTKLFSLQNKIPVVLHRRDFTNTVCFCAVISGGELYDSKNDCGMQRVVTELLALNFQNEIYKRYACGQLKIFSEVKPQVDLTSASVSVECMAEDLPAIIEAFVDALIFSENFPAAVDSIVMQQKSSQIVKTSSPVFQLKSNAVNVLFKNKNYQNAFSLDKDILKKVTYAAVLEEYSKLLNAGRYTVIVSGKINGEFFSGELENILNRTFGLLADSGRSAFPEYSLNSPAKKSRKVKLSHLFLTDVTREKAGPRPPVLIPTTDFLDPAQFWIFNESGSENRALFNAVLYDFSLFLENKFSAASGGKQNIIAAPECASESVPFAVITVLNASDVASVEKLYKEAFDEYKNSLSEDSLCRIKSLWIKKTFAASDSNCGMCALLKERIEKSSEAVFGCADDYERIQNLTLEEIEETVSSFAFDSVYAFYSADTKNK